MSTASGSPGADAAADRAEVRPVRGGAARRDMGPRLAAAVGRPDEHVLTSSTRSTSPASAPPCSTSTPAVSSAATWSTRCWTAVPGRRRRGPGRPDAGFPDDPDLPDWPPLGPDPARRPWRRRSEARPGTRPRRPVPHGARCATGRDRRATLAVAVRGPAGPPSASWRRATTTAQGGGGRRRGGAARGTPTRRPRSASPVRAHLPELSLVVQGPCPACPSTRCSGLAGPAAARGDAAGRRRARRAAPPARRQPPDASVDAELDRFGTRAARGRGRTRDRAALRRLAEPAAGQPADLPRRRGADRARRLQAEPVLLLDDRHVVLLDLDHLGAADQAGDVGTFLASLRQRPSGCAWPGGPTRQPRGTTTLAEACSSREYLRAAGATGTALRRRIAWYEAVALERKALRRLARAPRSPVTGALVAEGHRSWTGSGTAMSRSALRRPACRPTSKAPEKPSARRGWGLSDYRRGFALLRQFPGGRRPFVVGVLLLLGRGRRRGRRAHPDRLPGRLPAGRRSRPCTDPGGRRSAGRSGARRSSSCSRRRSSLLAAVNSAADSLTEVEPGPGRPVAGLQRPGRDVLPPAAAVAGLPRQAAHRRRADPGDRRRPGAWRTSW